MTKSYTSIEQAKILAKILPLESADMYWWEAEGKDYIYVGKCPLNGIPAWSVSALLDYLAENHYTNIQFCDCWELDCIIVKVVYNKNLLDACYEMIVRLYEQNLL